MGEILREENPPNEAVRAWRSRRVMSSNMVARTESDHVYGRSKPIKQYYIAYS
jgi:hypothetical protein